MPYLIDGHNLIPNMGLRLDALDDERDLIVSLNEFCRLSRRGQVEIWFDNASSGTVQRRRVGQVTAGFVPRPSKADDAIRRRLVQLGRAARNWTVVTSDREVQKEARSKGAKVITSEEFARTVMETLRLGPEPSAGSPPPMSEDDVEKWLKEFRDRDHKFGQF